ncbi:EAL domain-containing protein [Aestuariivirga sp.]|uniref:sensor domain-containing phosphodiesterase n=1 Tax=Aestuariivirga sp. TaxID=2650926 RepID=UPI003919BBD3
MTEAERLAALYEVQILDTEPSIEFDAVTRLVAQHFGVPMCAVSFLDADRQWFKSEVGLGCSETPRTVSFCNHAIRSTGVLVVPDATRDERFASNPLVVGEPGIRFYAGYPISITPGVPLGALCMADCLPRTLSSDEVASFRMYAVLVESLLRSHRSQLEAKVHAKKQEEVAAALRDHAQQLERQNRLFELAARQAKLGAWEYELESGEVVWSSELSNVLDLDRTSMASRSDVLERLRFPQWFSDGLAQADENRAPFSAEVEIVSGKGIRKWLAVDSRIIQGGEGGPRRSGISMDVTEAKLREESFKLLFDHNPLPMWVYEYPTQQFLAVNDAALRQYGYSRDQFLSMNLYDIRPPQEHQKLKERLATEERPDQVAEDWIHRKADGTCFTASIYSREIRYRGRVCAITAAIDVTQQRQHEETITYLAHHDALTQLPNRRLLQIRLEECLVGDRPEAGVMLIDFDNFKVINDTFGHEVGDQLIVGMAERLRSELGQGALLARLGGDEFAVVVPGAGDREHMSDVAARLLARAAAPLQCAGHSIATGLSIGITLAPMDGQDANTLLRNADLALYRAKGEGRNTFRFFEPQMYLHLVARRELEHDLRRALERQEFEIHYQPIVDLKSGSTIAFEALLRWNHPRRGCVAPAEFISVAEETGLVEPISDWVMQKACAEASAWPRDYKVAVNVSAAQFTSCGVVKSVQRALAGSGLPPARLEIEITESLILENSDKNIQVLNELHALGVTLSLDDFGTGYSSLSRLQHLPVDKLKIDQSFVSGLGTTTRELKIIHAAISLGRSLQITTVAEGVETEEQARILRRLGCDQAQGFYFGRPRSLEFERRYDTRAG